MHLFCEFAHLPSRMPKKKLVFALTFHLSGFHVNSELFILLPFESRDKKKMLKVDHRSSSREKELCDDGVRKKHYFKINYQLYLFIYV